MAGIVRVTQRGGEIRRTDKHPVNAVHLKNRVQILQRGSALDLYQQTEFVIRLRHIILYPSPARRSRHASANTAATDGRITGRRDHFPRLLGGIDHRHQQGSGANIQHLFYQAAVALDRTNDRLAGVGGNRLQLMIKVLNGVRGMLAVDQQPVVSRGRGDLGHVGGGGAQPQADLRLTA